VNKKLKKEIFDCSQIGDFYDCGCADKDQERKTADKVLDVEQKTELDADGRDKSSS
jgi:FAD-linked sulfhydryl oxidase